MAYSVLQGLCGPACGTFTCLLRFRNPIRALLLASLVAELATAAVLGRVETSVRTSQGLDADLRTLCDAIGPRMAGTEAMRDALQWGLRSFRDAGLQNARLEPVPIPLAWREGETRIEVVQPRPFRLRAAASAFSPSVREPMEAELALGGTGQRGAILQARESLRGKVVLVELSEASSLDNLGLSQRDSMVAVREAAEVGALAVLIVSTRPQQLLYRHVNNLSAELDPIRRHWWLAKRACDSLACLNWVSACGSAWKCPIGSDLRSRRPTSWQKSPGKACRTRSCCSEPTSIRGTWAQGAWTMP